MQDKKWYMSKTIWAGVVIAAYGVGKAFGLNLPDELIISLASALGLVGVRQAIGNKGKI